MPIYQYTCESCSIELSNKKINKNEKFDGKIGFHKKSKEYLFTIECKMKDKPSKPVCPRCKSNDKVCQSYTDYKLEFWIRGNGLVNDIGGARRDMHRHKLNNDDPYGHMREKGEKDYLDDKFRRAGMNMQMMKSESADRSRKLSKLARSRDYDLNKDQIDIIKIVGKKQICCYEDFDKIEDVNKILSSLMPDYICKTNNRFILMALGRMLFEEFTS